MKGQFLPLVIIIVASAAALKMRDPPDCSKRLAPITFHSHENRCDFYYICYKGDRIVYRCPDLQFFDENTKLCTECVDFDQCCLKDINEEDNKIANPSPVSIPPDSCPTDIPTTENEITTKTSSGATTLSPTTTTQILVTTERVTTLMPTTERFSTPMHTTERFSTLAPTTERFTVPETTADTHTTVPTSSATQTTTASTIPPSSPTTESTIRTTPETTTMTSTTEQITTVSTTSSQVISTTASVQISTDNIQTTPQPATTTLNPYCETQPKCTNETQYFQLPYIPDCTKFIYCDEGGIENLRKCPPDTHFSPAELFCIPPEEANCPDCSHVTTENPDCSNQPHCTEDTLYVKLPYLYDCTMYIYCDVNNTEKLRRCPANQLFSSAHHDCFDAELAICNECNSNNVETTAPTTPEPDICNNQPKCTQHLSNFKLPYLSDCNKYIYCDEHGIEKIMTCSDSQHFNPEKLRCMAPELAKCPHCLIITVPPTPCFKQKHCTPEIKYTRLPYMADCSKFIYCDNDKEIMLSCPENQYFSPSKLYCTDEASVECVSCDEDEDVEEVVTTENPYCYYQPRCTTESLYYTLPYVRDCTRYIYCAGDGSEQLRSCSDNKQYSPSANMCLPVEEALCPYCPKNNELELNLIYSKASCQEQPHCTVETAYALLPYVLNCSMYIYCNADGTEDLRQCPETNVFSPTELYCTTPELANCPACPAPVVACGEYPTCSLSEAGILKPYSPDCSKFIACGADGTATLHDCPFDQQFSAESLRCTDPSTANCVNCTPQE